MTLSSCTLPIPLFLYRTRHEFPPIQWTSTPIRKYVVTPVPLMPLLQQRAHLAWQVLL